MQIFPESKRPKMSTMSIDSPKSQFDIIVSTLNWKSDVLAHCMYGALSFGLLGSLGRSELLVALFGHG